MKRAGNASPAGKWPRHAEPERRSLVPLAGIEPALLAELDFESSASTSSATGAFGRPKPASRSRRNIAAGRRRSTRCEEGCLDRAAVPRYEAGSAIKR